MSSARLHPLPRPSFLGEDLNQLLLDGVGRVIILRQSKPEVQTQAKDYKLESAAEADLTIQTKEAFLDVRKRNKRQGVTEQLRSGRRDVRRDVTGAVPYLIKTWAGGARRRDSEIMQQKQKAADEKKTLQAGAK
ncbi:Small EDRK-rich factor 1, partial [Ophiophagus hannah]